MPESGPIAVEHVLCQRCPLPRQRTHLPGPVPPIVELECATAGASQLGSELQDWQAITAWIAPRLEGAVNQLDIRPLQVLIEVLIAEVRRDRSLSFGVDVNVPVGDVHGRPDLKAKERTVWLTGTLSPRAKRELAAAGWTVRAEPAPVR